MTRNQQRWLNTLIAMAFLSVVSDCGLSARVSDLEARIDACEASP